MLLACSQSLKKVDIFPSSHSVWKLKVLYKQILKKLLRWRLSLLLWADWGNKIRELDVIYSWY